MAERDAIEMPVVGVLAREYAAGTVLFREGEIGTEMYVIHAGEVRLTRDVRGQETQLAHLPAGEFFGEMAIINNRPRLATATVVSDSRLLVIDSLTFEAMIRGNTEIALRIIKKLAARLAQVNAQVEVLLLKDSSHRVVHHLFHRAEEIGIPDGLGMRLNITSAELAEQIDVPRQEVEECLERLEHAKLVHREGTALYVAQMGRLDQFLEFLDMKERFGEL